MENKFKTNIEGFKVRLANEADCELILGFIRGLAIYEDMENQLVATAESLRESLFVKKQAEALIGEYNGEPAVFALFFHNYSTFLGKANLYLEDLFVKEEFRGRGFGKAMFKCLATLAVSRDCERLDWCCLDWNVNSIAFYEKLGARAMNEWLVFRLQTDNLKKLAAE